MANVTLAPAPGLCDRRALGPVSLVAPVLSSPAYAGSSPAITPGTWSGSPTLTYSLEIDGVEVESGSEQEVEAYVYTLADEGLDAVVYEIADGNVPGAAPSNTVTVYDLSTEAGYHLDIFADPANVELVDDAGTSRVSEWAELARAGTYVQGTMGNRPAWVASRASLGGRPAVHLPGSARYMNGGPGVGASDITAYFFGDMLAASSALRLLLSTATANGLYLYQTVNATDGPRGFRDEVGSKHFTAAASTGAQAFTWKLVRGGAAGSSIGYRGNTAVGTATCGSFAAGAASTLGRFATVDTQYADLMLGRLTLFAAAHNDATQARVRGWGASYYEIVL